MNIIKDYRDALKRYYDDSCDEGFQGMDLIGNVSSQDLKWFNGNLMLEDIINAKRESILNELLEGDNNINFVIYLLGTKQLTFEVNYEDEKGRTAFTGLAKHYLKYESYQLGRAIGNLLSRGYAIRQADVNFVNGLYSNELAEDQFLNWSRLRFAVLTRNGEDFLYALKKQKVFFAILSFKLGRPIYYKFPNLLGVASNAIHNYSDNWDLILRAIEVYRREAEIKTLDLKKGNLSKKSGVFQVVKPEQDSRLEAIAGIIFPELSRKNGAS